MTGRRWHPLHTLSFCLAALALLVATVSGLSAFAKTNFTINSIQHVLVGLVAPVLLALSAPITLALRATSRSTQTAILNVLHGRGRQGPVEPVRHLAALRGVGVRSVLHQPLRRQPSQLSCCTTSSCCTCWSSAACWCGRPSTWTRSPTGSTTASESSTCCSFLPFHTILGMAIESQTQRHSPGYDRHRLPHRGRPAVGVRRDSRAPRHHRRVRAVAAGRTNGRPSATSGPTSEPPPSRPPTGGKPGRPRPGPLQIDRVDHPRRPVDGPRSGQGGGPPHARSTAPTRCPGSPAGRSCSSPSTASGPGRSRSGGRTTT